MPNPQSYDVQMNALNQLVKQQEEMDRRQNSTNNMELLSNAAGSIAGAFNRPSMTAAEIMAGRGMPQDRSSDIKQSFTAPVEIAKRFDQQRAQGVLDRYRQATQRAQLMSQQENRDLNQQRYAEQKQDKKDASELAFSRQKELLDYKNKNAKDIATFKELLARTSGGSGGATGMGKPTKGQEAVDKEFAKEYVAYKAKGGFSDTYKQLDQLNDAIAKLRTTDTATGPIVGRVPKFLRDAILPESASIQEAVEEVVQRNLRQVLGAQFTEKEGTRLIERAYNPRLSEAENVKRLNRLIDQIKTAAKAKEEAMAYYEEKGTLQGFKGKVFKSADEFLADKEYTPSGSSGTAYAADPEQKQTNQQKDLTNLPSPLDVDNMSEDEIDAYLKQLEGGQTTTQPKQPTQKKKSVKEQLDVPYRPEEKFYNAYD